MKKGTGKKVKREEVQKIRTGSKRSDLLPYLISPLPIFRTLFDIYRPPCALGSVQKDTNAWPVGTLSEFYANYDFEVRHLPGNENVIVDYL